MDLNNLWFLLLGVLLTGYAILDGFDFGVGILHLFIKKENDRRLAMNSIGPVWDGNEVWLVTFGGAMFAAFPIAYASIFSGFYLPFVLVLFALIGRAVALEFRSKMPWKWWRNYWDFSFSGASFLCALLFGVAIGNMIQGVPIRNGYIEAGLLDLLKPYPLLVGALTVSLFAMHGASYLNLKTEGDLQKQVKEWMWSTWGIFTALYILTTIVTLVTIPNAAVNFQRFPIIWVIVFAATMAIANIPRAMYHNYPREPFYSSCVVIIGLNSLLGAALYPNLAISTFGPENNINIYNAASSTKTLGIMAIIAAIGMPMVLAYTFAVYKAFSGKVKIGEHSY